MDAIFEGNRHYNSHSDKERILSILKYMLPFPCCKSASSSWLPYQQFHLTPTASLKSTMEHGTPYMEERVSLKNLAPQPFTVAS